MHDASFWRNLESQVKKYDLLCHPFYKAWAAGELTREDLRAYASAYFPHVSSFPKYLETLAGEMPESPARIAVLQNAEDELGIGSLDGRSHADLWLDFAEGMGARREDVETSNVVPEVAALVSYFQRTAQEGSLAAALAAFYAYESQVPRVAKEKARGLKELYGANPATCQYFSLHTTADVHHAQVWRDLLDRELAHAGGEAASRALESAEQAAQALWLALDGIERERLARSN